MSTIVFKNEGYKKKNPRNKQQAKRVPDILKLLPESNDCLFSSK